MEYIALAIIIGTIKLGPYHSVSTLSFNQIRANKIKLEQLEHLHSEIPPAAPWLPILVIHIRFQVKTRQSSSYKFKKIAKNLNFARNFTCDTPSEVAWQDV